MCEVRFSVTGKDGKLEGMLNAIPSNVRTEVAKEALRYFLMQVRDRKVESNYINAELLDDFRVDIEKNSFSVEDMMKILSSQQTFLNQSKVQYIAEQPVTSIEPVVSTKIEEDMFDVDLSVDEFNTEKEGSVSMDDINFDEMDF